MRFPRLASTLLILAIPLLAVQPGVRPRHVRRPPAAVQQPKLPAITPLVMLAILHSPRTEPALVVISESQLVDIAPGQSRDSVIAALGQPISISRVQGLDDGPRERFLYRLSPTRTAAIQIDAGRVASVTWK